MLDISLGFMLTSCHVGASLERSTLLFHTKFSLYSTLHYTLVLRTGTWDPDSFGSNSGFAIAGCVELDKLTTLCLSRVIYKMELVIPVSSLGYREHSKS